ncbi:MAG: hypothetical protein AABY22_24015, partial [Nanoarchaeota archaeon]
VRNLSELAAILYPMGKAGVRGAIGTTKSVVGKSSPLLEAEKIQKNLLLGNKEEQLEKTKNKLGEHTESYEEAKNLAKNEGISTDHQKLVNELNVHDNKIQEAVNKSQELQENLNKLNEEKPIEPAKLEEKNIKAPEKKELTEPEKPLDYERRYEKANKDYDLAENNLVKAKEHHEETKNLVNESNKRIGEYLESGSTHDVRAARLVKSDLESLKDKGTELYDEFENEVKDQGINLPNTIDIKKINDQLSEMVNKNKDITLSSKEAKGLLQDLDNANVQEVIPATKYVSMIKAVKGYMREAYKKAYEPGINEDKRVHYKEQGQLAEIQLEKMNKILEEHIGKENYSKLNEANDYWKKNIIPLYGEPLYWKIINQERMSASNMASELRGGKEGSGLDIIKNVLKNNSQAVKHVVGQRYDAGTSIHRPNELIKEYTDLLPDVKKLSDQQVQSE